MHRCLRLLLYLEEAGERNEDDEERSVEENGEASGGTGREGREGREGGAVRSYLGCVPVGVKLFQVLQAFLLPPNILRFQEDRYSEKAAKAVKAKAEKGKKGKKGEKREEVATSREMLHTLQCTYTDAITYTNAVTDSAVTDTATDAATDAGGGRGGESGVWATLCRAVQGNGNGNGTGTGTTGNGNNKGGNRAGGGGGDGGEGGEGGEGGSAVCVGLAKALVKRLAMVRDIEQGVDELAAAVRPPMNQMESDSFILKYYLS